MSLRSKKPHTNQKPLTSQADILKGAMSMYRAESIVVDDGKVLISEGVDTNMDELGSPQQGVLVGSVKIRGTKMSVSPDQIMHGGKVYSTQSGKEIPYGHGTANYISNRLR